MVDDPWAEGAPWPPQGDEPPPPHARSCRCDVCWSDAMAEHHSQRWV